MYKISSLLTAWRGWSVRMLMYPAKTAGPIELPFGMWIRGGLRNRVLKFRLGTGFIGFNTLEYIMIKMWFPTFTPKCP